MFDFAQILLLADMSVRMFALYCFIFLVVFILFFVFIF